MAKGSTAEGNSLLCVAADHGYISQERFARLPVLAGEIGSMPGGLMKYLRKVNIQGTNYK